MFLLSQERQMRSLFSVLLYLPLSIAKLKSVHSNFIAEFHKLSLRPVVLVNITTLILAKKNYEGNIYTYNIFGMFVAAFFQQTVGISKHTNCAPSSLAYTYNPLISASAIHDYMVEKSLRNYLEIRDSTKSPQHTMTFT